MKINVRLNARMCRSLVFLTGLMIFTYSGYSQTLPDTSATWTIATISMGSYVQNATYRMLGDTVIGDHSYRAIYITNDSVFDGSRSTYYCAIREELGRWFFIQKEGTKEYMLDDFNKTTGDTIAIRNPWWGDMDLIVLSTGSTELTDGMHGTFEVGIYDGPSDEPKVIDRWIEGIGSENGLFYSGFFLADIGYVLLCYHYKDDLIYLNSPDGTCGYLRAGIDPGFVPSDIRISPNPVNDRLVVESELSLRMEVFDISGRSLFTSESKELDVSSLSPGVYVLKIRDRNDYLLRTTKFVKE